MAALDTREKLHCALSWPHEVEPEQEPAWNPWNRPARSVLAPFPGVPFQGWQAPVYSVAWSRGDHTRVPPVQAAGWLDRMTERGGEWETALWQHSPRTQILTPFPRDGAWACYQPRRALASPTLS